MPRHITSPTLIPVPGGKTIEEHGGGHVDVGPGETVLCEAGERVRYVNPSETDGCEYWAVCTPAFSPESVHREGE